MPTQFVLALAILLTSVVDVNATALDEVIAVVNNEALTLSEYQTRYKREQLQSGREGQIPAEIDLNVLKLLIDERIQTQAAQAAGLSVSRAEVASVMTNMADQNKLSPTQLMAELKAQGISEVQFLRSIEEQRLIQRIVDIAVNSRVSISEQEIDYYLQAHKDRYADDETYEISYLSISTAGKSAAAIESELENVNHIHQGLLQGQSFSNAVQDFSDGENKEEGGYLGWRKEDQLPELFLEVLRKTPVGGVTEIIKTANAFHIIKLHDKKGHTQKVTQLQVRHILMQPQRHNLTAQEVVKKLAETAHKIRRGEDFGKFARLISDDESTAHAGGSLGWVNPGDTAPLFEQAALKLPLNQVSDPVRSQFGYHLIEVLGKRNKDISRDIARNNAREKLFKRKAAELYQNWFDRLLDNTYIEYLADN